MNLKILIAEDDRHTRKILEHIFTKDPSFADKKVELFLAPDGEEALQIFKTKSPDLVISDLLMPKLDGFALCRAIRKTDHGKDVPLIVTSAIYKETALLNRMRDELKVEFFAKPFQVRELLRGVHRMLEHRQKIPASVEPPREKESETSPLLPPKGSLRERHAADLILTALENKFTGTLSLKRGKISKEIFFVLGSPIGAESNVRNETMGHYLAVKRILDGSQLDSLLAAAREDNSTIMQALVKKGWLPEDVILRHHTALVKLRIINCLRWNEGSFSFKEGDDFSERMPRCAIEPVTIILLGLKRLMDVDEAAEYLNKQMDLPLKLTVRGERYRDVFIKVYGDKILNHLSGRPSVEDLIAKGLNSMTTYSHIMVLLKTGMANFGTMKRRFSSTVLPSLDPLALEHLKTEASEQNTKTLKDSSDQVIYQEIFGVDEISVVTTLPEKDLARREDSGVLHIPGSADEESREKLSPEDIRKLVVSRYLNIHNKNYYEILEVSPESSQAQIDFAYSRMKDLLTMDNYSNVDLGTDHPKLEEILQLVEQAHRVLGDPNSRTKYDEKLKASELQKKPDPLEAELYFREGEQKLKLGKHKDAVESFENSVRIDPNTADYLAYLAWARYKASSQPESILENIEKSFRSALEMNPDLISANLFLGNLYKENGNMDEALICYEKVLEQEPNHETGFSGAYEILAKRGEWRILERYHRKILHRLGNRFPERSVFLWKSLASLYEKNLENKDNARTCLEIALELAPDDKSIVSRLKALSLPEKTTWGVFRDKLVSSWLSHPEDTSPLEELFDFTKTRQMYDAAYVCSSCIAAISSSSESRSYYKRFRPPFLQRVRRPMDDFLWGKIRHADDDPQIETLFKVLSGLPEEIAEKIGLLPTKGQTIARSDETTVFFKVLDYLCNEINIPVPSVVLLDKKPSIPVRLLSAVDSRVGVSSDLLTIRNELSLAGALAPQVPYLIHGRTFAGALTSSSLKSLLMGAMLLVAPKLNIKDPTGEIHKIRDGLSNIPLKLKEELTAVIMTLTKQRSSLNLGRWTRAVKISSLRWGLLMVGDLVPLVKWVGEEIRKEILVILIDYALSDAYLEARRHLGLTVDV